MPSMDCTDQHGLFLMSLDPWNQCPLLFWGGYHPDQELRFPGELGGALGERDRLITTGCDRHGELIGGVQYHGNDKCAGSASRGADLRLGFNQRSIDDGNLSIRDAIADIVRRIVHDSA